MELVHEKGEQKRLSNPQSKYYLTKAKSIANHYKPHNDFARVVFMVGKVM